MKCFAITSGTEYIMDRYQPIIQTYWNGFVISTVEDVEEAKHYKNKNIPTKWVDKWLPKAKDEHKVYKKKLKEATLGKTKYQITRYQENVDKAKIVVDWLTNASVIELDLEHPNFPNRDKIRWDEYRHGDHASVMKLSHSTHSRYTCKACGIKLKNIPYYELPLGNSTKICIPCLHLRVESIKKAYEGMDEDFRESITNELVLGSL